MVLVPFMVLTLVIALYEEPPGGCQGPRDDFDSTTRQFNPQPSRGAQLPHQKGAQHSQWLQSSTRSSDAPVTSSVPLTSDETAEMLERDLYEKESAHIMQLPEEDWVRCQLLEQDPKDGMFEHDFSSVVLRMHLSNNTIGNFSFERASKPYQQRSLWRL